MSGKYLTTFTSAEVETHNRAKSCYVTVASEVYDVTSFIYHHPGGSDLILRHLFREHPFRCQPPRSKRFKRELDD
ncbi:hypothetical protein AFLA70_336g001490 [Aspergillus flavus AF70]|nr:hypothetical protein AFLA70_336g001490 [Aspergillus flavus AF70]